MFGRRRGERSAEGAWRAERGALGRPGFVGAALVLVVVLVIAVLVIVDVGTTTPRAAAADPGGSGGPVPGASVDDTPQAPPNPVAPGVTVPPPRPAPVGDGTCAPFPDSPTAQPGKVPSHIEWTDYRGLMVPLSGMAGPAERVGSVARCFAPTPTGALLAAANIVMRHPVAPDWRSLAERQMVPGPGRDAYLRLREQQEGPTGVAAVPPAGDRLARLAGFRFVSYSPQSAAVALLFRMSNGELWASVHTVDWSEGDWKLHMRDDGSDAFMEQTVAGTEGYVEWGDA
ncbi:hypothetical protein [Yinghuangia sp. YIM S09857]|uniref:hypothetical protein n=1 Tax=Yinghuangia sp. YIM S09857 TaxID=3436929 RepID=UPI003F53C507